MSNSKLKNFVEIGKKIVCVGRNYSEHAKEMGAAVPSEPLIFLKPTTSYLSQGNPIKLPPKSDVDHEVELGVVIGQGGSDISQLNALSHVGGYVLALDMTNRTRQREAKKSGTPWSLAKGFDTSCPVSDFIPKEDIPDPQNLPIWLKVNGNLRQNGNTKDMIFSIPYLISYVSEHFTLEEGDLLLTGTPSGIGPVVAGDVIECGLGDKMTMTFNAINK